MKNRFKFRVWDTDAKKYGGPDGFQRECDPEYGIPYVCVGAFGDFDKIPEKTWETRFVIQQWTGLYDKNDKEIYEGDIVNFTNRGIVHGPEPEEVTNALVHWDEETAMFYYGKFKDVMGQWYGYTLNADRIIKDSFEMIGNIFENPDLLK